MSLRPPGDDIPLARRSRPVGPKRSSPLHLLLRLAAASALAAGLVVLLLRGPLAARRDPLPVEGLNARLSADGRLLGHFPFPQVSPDRLVAVTPGMLLRPDAAEALLAMQREAAREGVDLAILSAYRDRELQRELFFSVKAERNQSSRDRARVSAPPGFSEHSTGFAVDLGDASRPDTDLGTAFEDTAAFRWLRANAARHHFHLSFPRDNPQGVAYEPWHWRYEGSTDALRLFEPSHRLAAGEALRP